MPPVAHRPPSVQAEAEAAHEALIAIFDVPGSPGDDEPAKRWGVSTTEFDEAIAEL